MTCNSELSANDSTLFPPTQICTLAVHALPGAEYTGFMARLIPSYGLAGINSVLRTVICIQPVPPPVPVPSLMPQKFGAGVVAVCQPTGVAEPEVKPKSSLQSAKAV